MVCFFVLTWVACISASYTSAPGQEGCATILHVFLLNFGQDRDKKLDILFNLVIYY